MCRRIGREKAYGILQWAAENNDGLALDGGQAITALAPFWVPPLGPMIPADHPLAQGISAAVGSLLASEPTT